MRDEEEISHCCHVRLLRSEKKKWREERKGEGDGFI
jgi:hypothetical protein